VNALPASDPSENDAAQSSHTVRVLWAGVDPRTGDAIAKALDDAGIEHTDDSAQSLFLPAMRDGIREIRVASPNFDAAEKVLSELWDSDADNDDSPTATLTRTNASMNPFKFDRPVFGRVPDGLERERANHDSDDPVPDDYLENFDPNQATVLVWSGQDRQMAQIFKDCLSNVGIGSVLQSNSGKTDVFVMASADKRAREIVREIQEGTPMA
jgi:hypothetical protein